MSNLENKLSSEWRNFVQAVLVAQHLQSHGVDGHALHALKFLYLSKASRHLLTLLITSSVSEAVK